MDSGVATRPIKDFDAYREQLDAVRLPVRHRSWSRCSPRPSRRPSASSTPKARTSACCARRRSWSTRGSRDPMLIGRPDVIASAHRAARPAAQARRGLRAASTSSTIRAIASTGASTTSSRGARASRARRRRRRCARRPTLIGAMLVHRGDADAMLCGTVGNYADHLRYVAQRDRPARGREDARGDADADPARAGSCSSATRTSIAIPTAEQIAEMTLLAAEEVRRFGIKPQRGAAVALELRQLATRRRRRRCATRCELIVERAPGPRGRRRDARRLPRCRRRSATRRFPDSRARRRTPTCWSCRTSTPPTSRTTLLRVTAGGGITVGGDPARRARKPVHIMTPSSTVRRIVNMTAVAVADARRARG